jgi:filamentous hemagglutinin family protein
MTTIKIILFTLYIFSIAHAEVITDGSLGAKVELAGKDFQITPELGQQFGSNLFHSFQQFNLSEGESATFSGASSVQNVIARVTGGSPSMIDGTLHSTIPNADLYFLNPYGVMFGQHAKLDLQGGFHVSTADYLRLQDGGRFEARNLSNSLLTVAPVAAFGFLTDTPAPITSRDSHLNGLKGDTLSFIGGGLTFDGTESLLFAEDGFVSSTSSKISAESGRLNLVSVASPGEVIPTISGLEITADRGAMMTTNTLLEASGVASGQVWMRAGQVVMSNSAIENRTIDQAGGDIDIEVDNLALEKGAGMGSDTRDIGAGGHIRVKVTNELSSSGKDNNGFGSSLFTLSSGTMPQAGSAGDITVQAHRISMTDDGNISSRTFSSGDAGNISIEADEINLTKGSIYSSTTGSGDAGNISIEADEINLTEGYIYVDTEGSGHAGNLTIQAQSISIANEGTISSYANNSGDAGNISIEADEINLTEGYIYSSTEGSGDAGDINIQADEVNLIDDGLIYVNTYGSGQAGNVTIQADEINLTKGSQINSATLGSGRGGTTTLDVSGTLMISGEDADGYYSGVFASSQDNQLENAGDAGSIVIHARQIIIRDGGVIRGTTFGTGHGGTIELHVAEGLTISGQSRDGIPSMISSSSIENADVWVDGTTLKEGLQHGNAGSLFIQVPIINILDGAEISARANRSGGGNIELIASQLIYLHDAQLTTSVKGGFGNGGNLTLNHPNFIVLNHGQIKAEADAGHGGNIAIAADNFVKSIDSLISASSNLGVDGQITIDSPAEDIGSQVLSLSANYLNAAGLFPRSCAARIADQRPSEFVRPFTLIVRPKTVAPAPEDTRASPYPVTMYYK